MRAAHLVHVTTVPVSLSFLHGQAGYMKDRGFEVSAVSSSGEALQAFAAREGVTVWAVDMPRRIAPFADLVAIVRMCRALHAVRPDIVHAGTPKGGLIGMVAAWIMRAPVRIYHIRGLPFMSAGGVKRLLLWSSERVACALAHCVLCVSHSVRDVALAERLCASNKVQVLLGGSGNGVDATNRFNPHNLPKTAGSEARAQFDIPQNALVIGFVGRVVRDKGIVELVKAWRALRDAFPHAHLLVVGPFEQQDPLPVEIESYLRKDTRIHLTGMDWDTPRLYAAMDLVILPTYREGFPNVPLEAAAMELPVVATRVPGCIDAVQDGVTGILVPPADAEALASAIRAYLVDGELRRQHGAAGRARVLTVFPQEAIWEAVYVEYCRLLEQKGLPVPSQAIGIQDSVGDGTQPSASVSS